MKRTYVGILLGLLLLAWGHHALLAQQQGGTQFPSGPQMATPPGGFAQPQWSQTPTPYIGNQPFSPMPQGPLPGPGYYSPSPYIGAQPYAPPQTGQQSPGYYRLDGVFVPQGSSRSQFPPMDSTQVGIKSCPGIPFTQSPSLPSRPGASGQSQNKPIETLWPGAPQIGPTQDILSSSSLGSQVGLSQGTFGQSQPQAPSSGSTLDASQTARFPGQAPGNAGQFFYEPPSTIEAHFLQIPQFSGESSKNLRQFGYALFASPISTFAPVEDVPVGPDYILGPGDDLTINIWGLMESAVMRNVNRNGEILLPTVGPVRVWGLTFSQADRLIREQLNRYYRGFQASVTMGRLRTIRVYVVGEVCQPGSYTLSSLSTVTNALFSSGGPLKLGSLRNIQLKRNHHDVGTVDLYDFLLRGDKTRDFRLESGDTIFIPPIGSAAAIEGEVKRPAIYEIKGPTRVSDLIEMAGGLTPRSYLKRLQIVRSKVNAEREVIDLDLTNGGRDGDSPGDIELKDGDLVRIYPTDPRIYNTVRLNGAVKHPGEYELKPGMRLSQILPREIVLPEAYLDRVDIARVKDDLTTEIIQVNLKQGWNGDESQDLQLKPRDLITVRSEYRTPWNITVSGEVKRPGTYTMKPGERLSSLLRRVGGFTDKAYSNGTVFTRQSVLEIERKGLDEFIRGHEQRLLAEAGQLTQVAFGISKEEAAAQQSVLVQRVQELRLVASKVTLGRIVVRVDEPDKLEGTPNDLILEDGDALMIPQKPATVVVMGSVRNPTAVLHQEGNDVEYYLNRAGGLTPEADAKGLYLLKADGSAITGFMRLRNIDPGDVVIAPPSTEAKFRWGPFLKDFATIAGQLTLGLVALAAIF